MYVNIMKNKTDRNTRTKFPHKINDQLSTFTAHFFSTLDAVQNHPK